MPDDNLHVEVAVLKKVVDTIVATLDKLDKGNEKVAVLTLVVENVSAALEKIDKRLERVELKVNSAIGSAIILGVMLGIYFLKSAFMK